MVGVTGQGSEQEKSAEVRIKQGQQTRQEQEQECRFTRYRAQEKHTPRQSLQVWPPLKYTSIISSRCLTGCKVESLNCWEHPLASPGTAAHKAGEYHYCWPVHS
ncbi:unnamed protein product [Staurois parvus]|uniref:Uncharacterized protein n=1 Tax=Staurois parvus TaxID=386267 RepID=A0ABN9ACA5_9NEOB|nr:unnamed protein product [Staurois parvus]